MRAYRRALVAIAATGISVCISGAIAEWAYAAATVPQATRPAPMAFSTVGALNGVAAVSKGSAWAVGYAGNVSAPRILLLHWNGTTWSRFTRPSVLTATGQLSAVTAVSAKDAWAVGDTGRVGTAESHSLLLHWNGSRWSQVTSPAPVKRGNLAAITMAARSGWAVGFDDTNPSAPLCCQGKPLVFRWNGSKWSRLATKKLGMGAYLNGVASTAANRAWAIGGPLAMITGGLAEWHGTAWSWAKDPVRGSFRPLNGIAAGPGGIAYVVGTDNDRTPQAVSARWSGKAWRQVPVRAPGFSGLNAIAFAPGGAAWAAGSYFSGGNSHPLVMRWKGTAWTPVSSPRVRDILSGLAFSAWNYGWAVGTTSTSGSSRTAILHWNGKAWG